MIDRARAKPFSAAPPSLYLYLSTPAQKVSASASAPAPTSPSTCGPSPYPCVRFGASDSVRLEIPSANSGQETGLRVSRWQAEGDG